VRERIPALVTACAAVARFAPAAQAKPAPRNDRYVRQVVTKSIRVANDLGVACRR
jgi:hypothetical protein